MGSTGSGRFSDYPGAGNRTTAGGATGGSSNSDKCLQAFSVVLEEVGNSQYYSNNRDVPAVGVSLRVMFDGQRVFAVDDHGVKVGALPTNFNYLVACLNSNTSYVGIVEASDRAPVPTVSADFVVE